MSQRTNIYNFIHRLIATLTLVIISPVQYIHSPSAELNSNKDRYILDIPVAIPIELHLFNQLDSIISNDKEINKYKYYDLCFYHASDTLLRSEPQKITKNDSIIIIMYSCDVVPGWSNNDYLCRYKGKNYILPPNTIPELISPQNKKLHLSINKRIYVNQLLRLLEPTVLTGDISGKLHVESKDSDLYFRVTE